MCVEIFLRLSGYMADLAEDVLMDYVFCAESFGEENGVGAGSLVGAGGGESGQTRHGLT